VQIPPQANRFILVMIRQPGDPGILGTRGFPPSDCSEFGFFVM